MKKAIVVLGSFVLLAQAFAVENTSADKSGGSAGEKAVDQYLKKAKKSPGEMELNPAALESQYAKQPKFDSDSADQKEQDKIVEANQKTFLSKTTGHIETLYECSKLGSVGAIRECTKASASKSKK